MPRRRSYKKRRRRSRKKRSFKKRLRFQRKGGRYNNVKSRAPLPQKSCVLMRYAPVGAYVLGDSSTNPINMLPQSQVFSVNGIYDPNITNTYESYQPYMFDVWKQHYKHYTVIGSQIKVRFQNQDPTSAAVVGIRVCNSKTFDKDLRQHTEGGNTKYAQLGTSVCGPDSSVQLDYAVNPAKFLGISAPMSNPQLQGTASANPVEQCYYQLFATNAVASRGCPVIYAYVSIEYRVVWREPVFNGLSALAPTDVHDHPTLENTEQVPDHTHDFEDVEITEGTWGDPDTATGTTEGPNPPE